MKLTNTSNLLAATFATALLAGSAAAAPITVTNFSFETPDITNQNVTGVPTGWTAPNGATGIKYRDNFADLVTAGIPDGNQWGLITFTASNKDVTLAQDTGVTIVEGVTYTLTVAVGEQFNQAAVVDIARIFLYGATTGDTAAFAVTDNIDLIGAGDDSAWADFEVSFTATAGQAGESLVIGLGSGSNIANGGTGFNSNVAFDNVRLEAVPEPGSLALLGLGGLCVLHRRRG
ncbi:MAG: PEP-CTERM sorting domain-containing protein [Phycisphaeraceae bacterium]|nr:PEP-CTERM sorting domain-containing protein [Phycisphaeraceae bacterium]